MEQITNCTTTHMDTHREEQEKFDHKINEAEMLTLHVNIEIQHALKRSESLLAKMKHEIEELKETLGSH